MFTSLLAVGSRAGILIGVAVLAMSALLLAWRARAAGLAVLGLFVISTVYGYGAFVAVGTEATLGRRDFLLATLRGIADNWLLGTGYGSFDLVYPRYERLEDIYPAFVNHAHNDFLEIALEGGLVGAVVVALYLGLIVARFVAIGDRPLQRLSFLSICVVLVHSSVDYPLRTTAIAAAFAFFNALFFAVGAAPSATQSRVAVHRRAEGSPSPH
jgi:O-antigen ligase